jgi:hypothetical protein
VSWSDRATFEGRWEHGAPNGRGSITWTNGDRYDGDFLDGRAEGQGVEVWANGDRYDGPWHNDAPNGLGTFTKKGGVAQRAVFVGGTRQGSPPSQEPAAATVGSTAATTPAGFLLADLAGKPLIAVDGSNIELKAVDGGIVRTIASPGGQSERVVFKILSGNLGTISETDGTRPVTGLFRVTDSGLDTEFADGRLEHISLNSGGGLTSMIVNSSGERACRSWYPVGHLFSKDERKAAVAAYAHRLGVSLAAGPAATRSSCDSKSSTRAPANPALARPLPMPIAEHTSLPPYKLGDGPANLQTVSVHDSVVHLIDQPPTMTAKSDVPLSGTSEGSASSCLRVDSDGAYWGFRNQCAYSVQFSYCVLRSSDETPNCGPNGSGTANGSASAGGFSALFADTSLSSGPTEHDFRWVACRGGAGEVVARLDVPEPASGRCVKPAEEHRQQAAN